MQHRKLSAKYFRAMQERYGAVSAYWRIGVKLNAEVGERASYRAGSLETVSTKLGKGFSRAMCQHCRRLARHWSLQDVSAADQAGLSLRSAIALLALDGLAERSPEHAARLKTRREVLIQRCRDGLSAAGLLAEITKARMKVLHSSQSGARRKHLVDSRRALTSLLENAAGRVERDVDLLPMAVRRRVRDLVKTLRSAQVVMERVYAAPTMNN